MIHRISICIFALFMSAMYVSSANAKVTKDVSWKEVAGCEVVGATAYSVRRSCQYTHYRTIEDTNEHGYITFKRYVDGVLVNNEDYYFAKNRNVVVGIVTWSIPHH